MITVALPDFERLHLLRGGAIVAGVPAAVFRITGPGALTCLQGLWTNDLVEPGEASLTYGALLTPKGMIITDGWALRTGEVVDLVFPPQAHDAVEQIFRRSLPPRLATAANRSDSVVVMHLLGDAATERWPVVPLGRLPDAGMVARCEVAEGEFLDGAHDFRRNEVALGTQDTDRRWRRVLVAPCRTGGGCAEDVHGRLTRGPLGGRRG